MSRSLLASTPSPPSPGCALIHFLVRNENILPLRVYLAAWNRALRPLARVLTYQEAARRRAFHEGTYVFSDLEILTRAQMALAEDLFDQLALAGDGVRLVNHPRLTLHRLRLLEALHAAGKNNFRAFPIADAAAARFPVFIRAATDHEGSLTTLIHNQAQLANAVTRVTRSFSAQGRDRADLIVVEYCDTSDPQGVFRKYSAFVVGDRVIAKHLLFSRSWMVKDASLVDQELLDEERRYVFANPHEELLRPIFQAAHLEYGRIDYAFLGARLQTWELNTNPAIIGFVGGRNRTPAIREHFQQQIDSALRELAQAAPGTSRVSVSLDPDKRRAVRAEGRGRMRLRLGNAAVVSAQRLLGSPLLRSRERLGARVMGPFFSQSERQLPPEGQDL